MNFDLLDKKNIKKLKLSENFNPLHDELNQPAGALRVALQK